MNLLEIPVIKIIELIKFLHDFFNFAKEIDKLKMKIKFF